MKKIDALKLSIKKWERIVSGDGEDRGHKDCACCQSFYCVDCPIMQYTGQPFCRDTPYATMWAPLMVGKAETPEATEAAQAELDFLKEVLKEME